VNDVCHNDAAYVLGALSPVDRQAYELHLRDCPDCRARVQRLAGMPGLLALTTAEAVEGPGPQVPPTLLPGLIARVGADRRRRSWLIGGALAASMAIVATLVSLLVLRAPTTAATTTAATTAAATTAAAEPLSMTQVLPGPMTASVELDAKKWGTAITVDCKYAEYADTSVSYDLAVIDIDGHVSQAGTWRAVAGASMRVATATSVPREHIAAVEVRLPNGRTILRTGP
jgi:hypothetical protein